MSFLAYTHQLEPVHTPKSAEVLGRGLRRQRAVGNRDRSPGSCTPPDGHTRTPPWRNREYQRYHNHVPAAIRIYQLVVRRREEVQRRVGRPVPLWFWQSSRAWACEIGEFWKGRRRPSHQACVFAGIARFRSERTVVHRSHIATMTFVPVC